MISALRRFRIVGLVILLTCSRPAAADIVTSTANTQGLETIAVMPFTATAGEHQAWLSKGLADLAIQTLGKINRFAVLERSRIQSFSEEIELGSLTADQNTALRMGHVAKVQLVLYGNYTISANEIALNVFLYSMEDQHVIQTASISGPLSKIRSMITEATTKIAEGQGSKLSQEESERIKFHATDSIAATENFYRGIDAFDHGRNADAYGEFLSAYTKDKSYYEALLWMGRMQEFQGLNEQAVTTYELLGKTAPAQTMSLDALLFAGRLTAERLKDAQKARTFFSRLAENLDITPQKYQAMFYLARIEARAGEKHKAYLHLKEISDFKYQYSKKWWSDLPVKGRNSPFFNWPQVFDLNGDVMRQMITLYQDLTTTENNSNPLPAPRGIFVLDLNHPVIEENPGATEPMMSHSLPRWREDYYAVIVPAGYEATAVDMQITGQCRGCHEYNDFGMQIHDFPLPADHYTKWLGAVYGQTEEISTLKKNISFFGRNKSIFIIKLQQDAGGRIDHWRLSATLKKSEPAAPRKSPVVPLIGSSQEGLLLSSIRLDQGQFSGSMKTIMDYLYQPKREIAFARDGKGLYHLVYVVGGIGEDQSSLWHVTSNDLQNWSSPQILPVTSLSKDYEPVLVPAEDGTLQLFWISQRRGLGWELWSSRLNADATWTDPARIPLDKIDPKFIPSANLLDFSAMQDSRGRWVIAIDDNSQKGVLVIRSNDIKNWKKLTLIEMHSAFYSLGLMEDQAGMLRLTGYRGGGQAMMYTSADGDEWAEKKLDSIYASMNFSADEKMAGKHATTLFDYDGSGDLVLLLSDNNFGLRFTIFDPQGSPDADLVTRANSEAYVAIKDKDSFIIALKDAEKIDIRRYKNFKTDPKSNSGRVYEELENDVNGNHWSRIFATMRYVVSDVTSGAVGPDDRVWWGIESGIMARKDDEFFLQDVSAGYFNHLTTHIASCDKKQAYVASAYLERSEIGLVDAGSVFGRNKTIKLGTNNPITSLICNSSEHRALAGTAGGDVYAIKDGQATLLWHDSSGTAVTAITADADRMIFLGFKDGRVMRLDKNQATLLTNAGSEISALAVDQSSQLWIAAKDKGLIHQTGTGFTAQTSSYSNVGKIIADPDGGIWFIAGGQELSYGVGYIRNGKETLYNPPRRLIEKPSSLDIDSAGNIWVGTWFDGMFKLTRKH